MEAVLGEPPRLVLVPGVHERAGANEASNVVDVGGGIHGSAFS